MGKHVGIRKRTTVFEYRYYYRRVMAAWIRIRKLIKARLNHG